MNLKFTSSIKAFAFIIAISTVQFYSGCAGPSTSVKKDSKVDTTTYKSYQWIGNPEAKSLRLENPNIDSMTAYSKIVQRPDIEPSLKKAVNNELKARNMVESNTPDFFVTYYGKAKNDDWISTWSGRAPSLNNIPLVMYPNFDRPSAASYRDGSLLLVFYDAKTKKPAWTGTMLGVIQEKKQVDLETLSAKLNQLTKEFTSIG